MPAFATWDSQAFTDWCARCGLSISTASRALGVSRATVQRLRQGQVKISARTSIAAEAWESRSAVTTGDAGAQLDAFATEAAFADLCAELPGAHLTGLTSAIARGWTTANLAGYRHVGQASRTVQASRAAGADLIVVTSDDLPNGVEIRRDGEGRTYRVASPGRTLIDLVALEQATGPDIVAEAYIAAMEEGLVDGAELISAARERGYEDRVRHYLGQDSSLS